MYHGVGRTREWKELRDINVLIGADDVILITFVNLVVPIYIMRALINEGNIAFEHESDDGFSDFPEHYQDVINANDKNNIGIWWV